MRASTIIGGASDKNKRNESDFYATPSECTIALIDALPDAFEYGLGGIIFETSIGNFAGEFDEQPPNLGMSLMELFGRILEFIFAGFGLSE